jgi:CRP-like cAMP-binding protein
VRASGRSKATVLPSRLSSPASRSKKPELPVKNLILSALEPGEWKRIRPHIEPCLMKWHAAIQEPSESIEFGYFPNNGVISLIVALRDGKTVEVGIVGKEGFIGAPLAGGLHRSPHRSLVQMPGDAHRIRANVLRDLLPSLPKLRILLTRYALVQGMQLAQTAACNRLHSLEQRMARWLLMTHDRAESMVLTMTHERLAGLLGSDRPSISDIAILFQERGLIAYRRGIVNIVNRRKLEAASCECYEVIQQYYSQLGLG